MKQGPPPVRMTRSRGILVAGAIVGAILAVQIVTTIAGAVIADRGTEEAARDTYSYIGDLMSERVASMADSASDVVRGTVAEIERTGRIPDDGTLIAAMNDRLDREPAVGTLFVGRPDGGLLAFAHEAGGHLRIDVEPRVDEPGVATVTRTLYDEQLRVRDVHVYTTEYSAEDRPWYRAAVTATGTAWTEPYVSRRTDEVVVSPVAAVRLHGELVAVVGADLNLDALGQLLDDIPIGEDARAFVLTEGGLVIAAPEGSRDRIRELVGETGDVPAADRFDLPLATPSPGADEAITSQGGTVILTRELDPAAGLPWVLHLEASAEDLAPGLHRFKAAAFTITAISMILAVVATAFVLRIWRPMRVMRHRATTDALTGVANRYEFSRRAREILFDSRDAGGAVLVVALDLDDFKGINDAGGHEAGDRVLAAVGHSLLRAVRARDVAGRWGGDEFVALLRLGDGASPADVALRLRDEVELAVHAAAGGTHVGVTAGYATSDASGYEIDTLVTAADEALVAGKRAAKGRSYGAGEAASDVGAAAATLATAGSLPPD